MSDKPKVRYEPYVSKSDRPKLKRAQQLKRIGLAGNISALIEANEMLSPKHSSPALVFTNIKRPNQRQLRKKARQQNRF